jgi:hypothetical protein
MREQKEVQQPHIEHHIASRPHTRPAMLTPLFEHHGIPSSRRPRPLHVINTTVCTTPTENQYCSALFLRRDLALAYTRVLFPPFMQGGPGGISRQEGEGRQDLLSQI